MRLSLLAVGRLKSGPERELVERDRQRIEGMGRSLGLSGPDHGEQPELRVEHRRLSPQCRRPDHQPRMGFERVRE